MTAWDYLAAHPDISHISYLDDASVMELFERAQIDPKTLISGRPLEQLMAAYSKHPTHWLLFTIYSGYTDPKDNGYAAVGERLLRCAYIDHCNGSWEQAEAMHIGMLTLAVTQP